MTDEHWHSAGRGCCPHPDCVKATAPDPRDADLAALRERLAAAEALSESRRVTLLAAAEELAAEWKRAEAAEALVRELAEVVKAAKNHQPGTGYCICCRSMYESASLGEKVTHDRDCVGGLLAGLSDAARKEIER